MPSDRPTLDEMRLALQRQPQAVAQPIPQSDVERNIGTVGGYLDKAGRFISEATQPIAKSHPVRTWLAENLIAAPLRNAGTAMQDWTNTPREITPDQPFTPAPFYGGSKATLNPHTWGPALQSFKTDPRVLDVAGVVAPANAALMRATKGLPVGMSVKPVKGGNWMNESVEQALAPIKTTNKEINVTRPLTQEAGNSIRYDYPQVDAAYSEYFRGTGKHSMEYAKDYWEWMSKNYPKEFAEIAEGKTPSNALNRWVDKKLTPYIKNEMATPNDPVRDLAERGVSHMPLRPREEWMPVEPDNLIVPETYIRREKAGLPKEGFAKTPLGQQWENYSDEAVRSKSAGMLVKQGESASAFDSAKWALDRNPWLKEVSPDTQVYHAGSSEQMTSKLGFDHLMDELRNAISPNSGLPQNLRLKPDQLDKVTVPQAVERVSKINEWRAAEAAKAEKAGMLENLNASARFEVPDAKLSFVDKPGMKWVDIPETAEEKGMKLCTTIGKQGGWCTQGEHLAKSYGSGDNRLTALLDAEGRPHAQAKISKSKHDASQTELGDYLNEDEAIGDQFYRNIDTVLRNRGIDEDTISDVIDHVAAGGPRNRIPENVRDMLPEIEAEAERMLPVRQLVKPDIDELKPVGNAFSSDRAREYARRDPNYQQVVQKSVLDFLNNGDWGKVKDLDHYNLVDLQDTDSVVDTLKSIYGRDMQKGHVLFNEAVDANPDAKRFMTRGDFLNFVEPPQAPAQGYRKGGIVKMAEGGDPSVQFYSRTMENPDNSKTTETGIAKQFEEDYMRFALQRHEQAKRTDMPNPPAPVAHTNIYGEYGTPIAGGMVSGRVTKLGAQPDTYMGDLAYRTNIGPGMAHVGVQGMRSPQMPAQVTNFNAGYNVPLGNNGFAGVHVAQPAQGGKPIFGAQLQYRKQFADGGAVTIDEMRHELMRNR